MNFKDTMFYSMDYSKKFSINKNNKKIDGIKNKKRLLLSKIDKNQITKEENFDFIFNEQEQKNVENMLYEFKERYNVEVKKENEYYLPKEEINYITKYVEMQNLFLANMPKHKTLKSNTLLKMLDKINYNLIDKISQVNEVEFYLKNLPEITKEKNKLTYKIEIYNLNLLDKNSSFEKININVIYNNNGKYVGCFLQEELKDKKGLDDNIKSNIEDKKRELEDDESYTERDIYRGNNYASYNNKEIEVININKIKEDNYLNELELLTDSAYYKEEITKKLELKPSNRFVCRLKLENNDRVRGYEKGAIITEEELYCKSSFVFFEKELLYSLKRNDAIEYDNKEVYERNVNSNSWNINMFDDDISLNLYEKERITAKNKNIFNMENINKNVANSIRDNIFINTNINNVRSEIESFLIQDVNQNNSGVFSKLKRLEVFDKNEDYLYVIADIDIVLSNKHLPLIINFIKKEKINKKLNTFHHSILPELNR